MAQRLLGVVSCRWSGLWALRRCWSRRPRRSGAGQRLQIGRLGRRRQQRRDRQVQRLHHDRRLPRAASRSPSSSAAISTGALVLVNDKWKLGRRQRSEVTLAIDSREPIPLHRQGGRRPWHPGAARERADPVVNAMRAWPAARRRHPIGQDQLQADRHARGHRRARRLRQRQFARREKAAGGTAAFAALEAKPPAENQDNANRLFTGSEAVAFASNLLASAGITDYQLIDPAKNPMPNFDVVWTYANGIIGAIAGYKDMGAVDLDEAANVVMADDAKNCKGDFASGKKPSAAGERAAPVHRLPHRRQIDRDPLHPGEDGERASDPARPSQARRRHGRYRQCRQRLPASRGAAELQVDYPRRPLRPGTTSASAWPACIQRRWNSFSISASLSSI